jgi:pimeloyl-ACP methyl ester carboxylesterase
MDNIELRHGDLVFDGIASGPPDGELVLLLHGFPQTPRAWSTQVEALGSAGFRAVAPALRGFGAGPAPVPPKISDYAQPLVAADVLGIASALGADCFHLVGHDLGGIVAWDLAGRHPRSVMTLAVASTPHLTPFAAALDAKVATRLPPFEFFRQVEVPEQAMLAGGAAALRASYAGLEEEAVEEYAAHFSAPGALTAALNHFRAFDYAEWLALPAAPMKTLFVWGVDDPYLAEETAMASADHVSGELRALPLEGIGHWVPETAADEVTDLLLEHLGRT